VDLRWLQAFDSLYCGDPRLSDVPARNFWRSMDLYTDHMVRYFETAGVPLERIDNTGFMVGVAGTCYARRSEAFKGMLLLEHARGGWMNVYYGNLELIDAANAKWFARVQDITSGCNRWVALIRLEICLAMATLADSAHSEIVERSTQ